MKTLLFAVVTMLVGCDALSVASCEKVFVTEVGGCNLHGICGVQLLNSDGKIETDLADLPVKGQTLYRLLAFGGHQIRLDTECPVEVTP